eukprot:GHVO01054490.1.p1 GENE.GHVO01054490.1~~GHVO01054490.1.p1  ORF type:complete len:265 (-),score=20.36 GHVO01054490.1:144-908(-)
MKVSEILRLGCILHVLLGVSGNDAKITIPPNVDRFDYLTAIPSDPPSVRPATYMLSRHQKPTPRDQVQPPSSEPTPTIAPLRTPPPPLKVLPVLHSRKIRPIPMRRNSTNSDGYPRPQDVRKLLTQTGDENMPCPDGTSALFHECKNVTFSGRPQFRGINECSEYERQMNATRNYCTGEMQRNYTSQNEFIFYNVSPYIRGSVVKTFETNTPSKAERQLAFERLLRTYDSPLPPQRQKRYPKACKAILKVRVCW